MVFSSITFIYYFLPIMLLLYFIVPKRYRNLILLIGSLIFYYYGEKEYTYLLIISSIVNYFFGKLISRDKHNKLYLIIGLIFNFSILIYFKYMNFFISNFNNIFNININYLNLVIPLGISFYTFQATSYLIDVYRGKIKYENNIIDFLTYLIMFPHLTSGPIVRYSTIKDELKSQSTSFNNFSCGVYRFTTGLFKKVMISDLLTSYVTALSSINTPSVLSYWLIAIMNTLIIYFDFSGYSDMAVGIAKMLGFNFLENFNYPFIANSITEFWRRWHISLSSWFRDYLYIPMGGNRVSKLRWYFNILIVWMATGFWHGASWNFILWGLFFSIFLVIEKSITLKYLNKYKFIGIILTNILIIISFVIFNNNDLSSIKEFLSSMFGLNNLALYNSEVLFYLKNYIITIILAILLSTPVINNIYIKIKDKYKIMNLLEPLIYIIILILTTAFILDGSFNSFVYFRF
jgi:alginate O-acetyltransferase complex protein AlgI